MDPRFLFYITDKIEYATEKFNQHMTNRIVKRILSLFDKNSEVDVIPSSVSDMRKMQETGKVYQEIKEAIKKKLPEIEAELDDAFERTANEIAYDNDRFTEQVVKAENIVVDVPEPDRERKKVSELNITKKEKALLQRAYKKTEGEIYNLTGTTAEAWQTEFVRVTDEAYWKATHGVSLEVAIADAIDEAAKYGTTVIYPSGHQDKIEVAVARAVRTGLNQAKGDLSITRCAEMGVSCVLVSSHLGARYTDKNEPANHMSWQGKVYSINWDDSFFEKYLPMKQEEKKMDFMQRIRASLILMRKKNRSAGDFRTITGYGTGEGLCGWNCRHTFNPFWEGVNSNNTEQYDSEVNKKRYDAEQQQRALERKLRESRKIVNARKYAADHADGDLKKEMRRRYREVKSKYSEQMQEYLDYCDKNNLRPYYDRLKVPETSNIDGATILDSAKAKLTAFRDEIKRKISASEYGLKLSQQEFSKHVEGSVKYKEYLQTRLEQGKTPQSVLDISYEEAQNIINTLSGTGMPRNLESADYRVEYVQCDKVIGRCFNMGTGKWIETKRGVIHHAKRGSHIVPVEE